MSKKKESIFIRKYVEILKFKSLVRNQKVKIIKPMANKKNEGDLPKIKLPYIKVLKNDIPSLNAQTTSDNNKNNNKNINEKHKIKTTRAIREINKSSEQERKKNIKVISDDFYRRLLKNNTKDNSLEKSNSAVNIHEELTKDDKDKEKKLMIKLPFLSNIKSRYKDYNNDTNLKRVINRSLNELDLKNEYQKRRPFSKLRLKNINRKAQKC